MVTPFAWARTMRCGATTPTPGIARRRLASPPSSSCSVGWTVRSVLVIFTRVPMGTTTISAPMRENDVTTPLRSAQPPMKLANPTPTASITESPAARHAAVAAPCSARPAGTARTGETNGPPSDSTPEAPPIRRGSMPSGTNASQACRDIISVDMHLHWVRHQAHGAEARLHRLEGGAADHAGEIGFRLALQRNLPGDDVFVGPDQLAVIDQIAANDRAVSVDDAGKSVFESSHLDTLL